MKPGLSPLIALMLFLTVLPLAATPDRIRVRTVVGMEPIGRLTVNNLPGGGKTSWSTGYGISPGIELYAVLGTGVEVGAGVMWQTERRVFRDGGDAGERFSFVPMYMTARVRLTEVDGFSSVLQVKLGYSVFLNDTGFREIWLDESWGGALTSTSGGLYASASLGAMLNLAEKAGWGLDLSMDVGYSFQSASGTNSFGNFPISYQAMATNIALDWRF
jgi:hypothetical protein